MVIKFLNWDSSPSKWPFVAYKGGLLYNYLTGVILQVG